MKLRTCSPFFYAIKHNMQGNIYLLLQKGFDQFAALAESLVHNKFNCFISVLDSIDSSKLARQTDRQGKNLLHVLAESTDESNVDFELLQEVYSLIVKLKVSVDAKDNEGRTPLHYALQRQNTYIASLLLAGTTPKQLVKQCNAADNHNVTAFAMLFDKLANNTASSAQLLEQSVIDMFGPHVAELIPFVRFDHKAFPYSFLSFTVEDKEHVHPLVLLLQTIN